MQIILPPLFHKLDTLPDGDRELLPLMECLTAGAARWVGGQGCRAAAAAVQACYRRLYLLIVE